MHTIKANRIWLPVLIFLLTSGWSNIHAAEPVVKTPAPVIYLESNLKEPGLLGWCIDTVGRGLSDRLHAHSCKPKGGDVQFRYDADLQNVVSVAYPQLCMTIDKSKEFWLLTCDSDNQAQKISYDPSNLSFSPKQYPQLCVAVHPESRKAGPFLSRDLLLTKCAETTDELQRWIIRE